MKKILMIIGGIMVALVLVGVIVFVVVSMTSKKLECKSDIGNITLMYTDKTVTGYKEHHIYHLNLFLKRLVYFLSEVLKGKEKRKRSLFFFQRFYESFEYL